MTLLCPVCQRELNEGIYWDNGFRVGETVCPQHGLVPLSLSMINLAAISVKKLKVVDGRDTLVFPKKDPEDARETRDFVHKLADLVKSPGFYCKMNK